jgi:amino acid transporter/nucleotide-binding universal stress UspA family protein
MLVTESRPRSLKWIHAGPLLYGDWGTSRLYVLGLAFLYTAHASVLYLAAIGVLMIAVAWAYTIICRSFPDGGGVYTAARQINPTLAVIGSTLLLSGYIMTAVISVVEAFHYFGIPSGWTMPLSVVTLVLIGAVNWLGAKSAGRFAMFVAILALGVSAVMAVMCLPFFWKGIQTISFDYFTTTPPGQAWVNFTKICLALAGVEAVANMTGLMKHPVDREAKRTIWPVAIEVVVLNLVFGLALAGMSFSSGGTPLSELHTPDDIRLKESRSALIESLPPELAQGLRPDFSIVLDARTLETLPEPTIETYTSIKEHEEQVEEYTNASMRVIASESGANLFGNRFGSIFGQIAGIAFGLLLLSATNTAVMAMVSVLFSMAQDSELPKALTKLNYSGVPWVGLVVAVVVPVAVIFVERDVTVLAKLYVLGVAGAITVSVLSCAVNKKLDIGTKSRIGMWALGLFLLSITVTIGVTQLVSTIFSGTLVALVLSSRYLAKVNRAGAAEPIPEPITGWLAEVRAQEGQLQIDPDKPKIMLAARGRYQAEFAVDLAKRRGGTLFAVFVRPIRVLDLRSGAMPKINSDHDAQEALGSTGLLAKANGVPFVPIYVVTPGDIAEEIVDHTVTYGCETLILGKSRRTMFSRKLQGDVVTRVVDLLPDEVALITRSASTPHESKLVMPEAARPMEEAEGETSHHESPDTPQGDASDEQTDKEH